MGFFKRKPDKETQALLVKQATFAATWFGHALRFKRTNPRKGLEAESIDLSILANREVIRNGVLELIAAHDLDSRDGERTTDILVSLTSQQGGFALDDAVLCTVFAIHAMNMTARTYYEEFPEFKPLFEMVNNLAKTSCAGAAWTIGSNLPSEVSIRWPYFAQIFEAAKNSSAVIFWPDA